VPARGIAGEMRRCFGKALKEESLSPEGIETNGSASSSPDCRLEVSGVALNRGKRIFAGSMRFYLTLGLLFSTFTLAGVLFQLGEGICFQSKGQDQHGPRCWS